MSISPLAGKIAPNDILIDVKRLIQDYESFPLDPMQLNQQVKFGTSGHRGTSTNGSFNRGHILAITQAVCEYRNQNKITGPLYVGIDSHALSRPALEDALQVLIANGVQVVIQKDQGLTPTPVISHAILTYNRKRTEGLADGIVITPSHNPPDNGGFKYNPPSGGPAGTEITVSVEKRANQSLLEKNKDVKKVPLSQAMKSNTLHSVDLMMPYIKDLSQVLDLTAIHDSHVRIGVNPLGGAAVAFWEPLAEFYKLNLTVTNTVVDPTFRFMTVDKDGKIRMDCSSPYAMESLIAEKDKFDIAFGNDTDADRHGIVTPAGLMNPNDYLAAAIDYLFQNREGWKKTAGIGKTVVSSSMIDRLARKLNRKLNEVPVGFKWFVDGLVDGSCAFGGEESAGASFLRKDGSVWTTDKDGLIMGLLAAEILAKTGKNPQQNYEELTREFGKSNYERLDTPIDDATREALKGLTPAKIQAQELAGEKILQKLDKAPGNHAAIGGVKVVTESGWFAVRPSGTENVYKLYAESFKGRSHLAQIQAEAKNIIQESIK